MKQTNRIVLFIALGFALVCCVSHLSAQQAAQQPTGPPSFVAVVDLAQLIKTHPEFTQRQGVLRDKMLAEESKFKVRQESIIGKEKALQGSPMRPGTKEHQDAVDEIAGLYTDYEKDVRSIQRRFQLESSQIMYDTYKDIKLTIERYAKARRIAQVTDHRYFEANPTDPQSVVEDMEQRLVWFDESLDITKFVIAQMYVDRKMPVPDQKQIDEMVNGKPGMPGQQLASPPGNAPR